MLSKKAIIDHSDSEDIKAIFNYIMNNNSSTFKVIESHRLVAKNIKKYRSFVHNLSKITAEGKLRAFMLSLNTLYSFKITLEYILFGVDIKKISRRDLSTNLFIINRINNTIEALNTFTLINCTNKKPPAHLSSLSNIQKKKLSLCALTLSNKENNKTIDLAAKQIISTLKTPTLLDIAKNPTARRQVLIDLKY